ncbi:MAG: imelysin family protein [Alphaproteobacteria bacterium]|nr:imelysin family protein [Alphaproteobacteria bacterium]
MRHAIALLTPLAALLALAAPAAAGPSAEAFASVNAALAENHIRPRYERLSAAAEEFEAAVEPLCARPDSSTLSGAEAGFQSLMDAWMSAEHLRFGPAESFMRMHRFHFWPEAQGKVGKAIAKRLAAEGAASTAPFRDASAAVQGLLAAEFLLYDQNASDPAPAPAPAQCSLLSTIAGNMRGMATGMASDWWSGADPFIARLASPGPENPYFESHGEAALAFLKSLHDGLQRIVDLKIAPVIGKDAGKVRPNLAESRLTGRSLWNIVLNLEALQELYTGGAGPGLAALLPKSEHKLERLLRKGFRATLATAESIEGPLESAAADPAQRKTVEKLRVQAQALRQIVRDRLAKALDLPLGFNALDGD